MLKQILSRGLFSYQLRSSNEVTPSRILGMSRMGRFKKFVKRCVCYQMEDERFNEEGQNVIHLYDWRTGGGGAGASKLAASLNIVLPSGATRTERCKTGLTCAAPNWRKHPSEM